MNVQNLVDGSPIGLHLDPPQQIRVVMLTAQDAEQEATVVRRSAYGDYKISQNEANDEENR